MGSSDRSSLLELTLRDVLDAVPARTPAPGAGAAAAIGGALAAGLAAMAARFAPSSWTPRDAVVARADELRRLLEPLADADGEAYAAYLAARTPEAEERIVEIPLALVEHATEVAELAARAAREGNPNLIGDAAAGAALAAAAASIGAHLVRINAGPEDARVARADAEAVRAAAAAREAVGRRP